MLKKMVRDTRPLKVLYKVDVVYHFLVCPFISQLSSQDATRSDLRASWLSCETVHDSHNPEE
jgi:hypothetical protein